MFKILDHTSDLEFLVESDSFEELVEESIVAVTSAVTDKIRGREERSLKAVGDEESSLMTVLEGIVYLHDAENFYPREADVRREGKGLQVTLKGGKADVKGEIKAATWHEFWVKEEEGRWKAHFICDI